MVLRVLRERIMMYFYSFIFLKIGSTGVLGIADFLQRNSPVVFGVS